MHLLEWEPYFELEYDAPTSCGIMRFSARMECPVCSHRFQVSPSGHLLRDLEQLKSRAELSMRQNWEIGSIKERRRCPGCGVVSELPEQEESDFIAAVRQKVTPEFIRSELEECRQEADRRWAKKHGYSALEAREAKAIPGLPFR